MKRRVGVFGNCQAKEVEHLFSQHAPFLDRYDLVSIKPVYAMTPAELAEMVVTVGDLDILICQRTGRTYEPATTENLRAAAKGEVWEFPSMWHRGHVPDMVYFRSPEGGKNDAAPTNYHSTIIASAFLGGKSAEEAARRFTEPGWISRDFVLQNYADSIAELERREGRCEVYVSDYIRAAGPHRRLFHTMNHPHIGLIVHATNQMLAILGIEPINAVGAVDRLDSMVWPMSRSVSDVLRTETQTAKLGGIERDVLSIVTDYYAYYEKNRGLVVHNKALLFPPWLRDRRQRWLGRPGLARAG